MLWINRDVFCQLGHEFPLLHYRLLLGGLAPNVKAQLRLEAGTQRTL